MKKRISLFIFVVVLLLTMACGCGSPATATPPQNVGVTPTSAPAISPTPSTPLPFPSLQLENNLPQTPLLTKPSVELADNRIGLAFAGPGLVADLGEIPHILEHLTENGYKFIHSSMYEIEAPIDWSNDEYNVPPEFDKLVNDVNENGIAFNYVLSFWDKAGHANGEILSGPRFRTEDQIQRFLDYIHFVVGHFKGRIQVYTIFNEPDNCGPIIQCIRPDDYIELIKRVVPVIRQEDPQAKVAIAPNVLYYTRNNFFTVLESDIMPLVDVVQWHGLYDVLPNSSFYGDYYYQYPALVEIIKQTAATNGFHGEYWATEVTWCSHTFPKCKPEEQPQLQAETDIQAGKYYLRGIVMHLGMDVGISLGGFQTAAQWSWPAIRNLNTVMAGATSTSLTVNVDGEATNIMSYAFTLPNGDRLFAIWTNDEAIEDDPGVSATLTIPGSSAQSVTGVDVLNGFEQELITEAENGDLVIRNLLVKDYPIILRFAGASFAESSIVEPTATLVEPVTIKLRKNAQEQVPAGTPIQLTIGWLTDTEAQVGDFLTAINMTGTLDGQPLPDLNGYWGEVEPYEGRGYISHWLYPLGVLSPGTHTVEIRAPWIGLSRTASTRTTMVNWTSTLAKFGGSPCRWQSISRLSAKQGAFQQEPIALTSDYDLGCPIAPRRN